MQNFSRMVLVGADAKEFLCSLGEAKIIGVFRRCLYLENSSGRLVCIGERGIGPGPLNALCEVSKDVDFSKIFSTGSSARVQNGSIYLYPEINIDVSRPEVWEPEPFPMDWDLASFLHNLSFIVQWIDETGPREGLASLIANIVSGEEISRKNVFQSTCWKGISDFRHWLSHSLHEGRKQGLPAGAQQLIGLGPGLTPSGDDFWCGVMIALRLLEHYKISEKIADTILSQAKERTNKISCAHLQCAAGGQGAQALHETISAMGVPDEARLNSALHALDKIGHTSGWDTLVGVVCVFLAVASLKGQRILV